MCRLVDRDPWGDLALESVPRSTPHLTWAIPVDIIALSTNLEAYSSTIAQVNTLRLCHRFRDGPLSRLPQEILELVIDEIHRLERHRTRPDWVKRFNCFRNICHMTDHMIPLDSYMEDLWHSEFAEEEGLDPDDYTDEEKAKMLIDDLEFLGEHEFAIHENLNQLHIEMKDDWISSVCLCLPSSGAWRHDGFAESRDTLKAHFGLDIFLTHELLSEHLGEVLPSRFWNEEQYYTSAFLTLPANDMNPKSSTQYRTSDRNHSFLPDNQRGFIQMIDLSKLILSEEQKRRFRTAMKILDLSPHFHISKVEDLLSDGDTASSLEEMCRLKSPDRPSLAMVEWEDRRDWLDQYVKTKSDELAKQSWPQLLLLASSDAAIPD